MERTENNHGLYLLLALLALSTILDGLDASIISVALPTISMELDVSVGDTSWITLTYVIALAALLLPLAKLAKNGTVKRVFFWGIVVFTVSSVACGLSGSFASLVVFRLVQGIGAALMTAAVPVLIAQFIPADKKGLGLGVLAVASGVSIVLGPSVGGFVTSALDWRWIFLMNIPFGIVAAALTIKAIPKDEGYDKTKNPDLLSSILAVFGIGSTIVCIQNIVGSAMPMTSVAICGVVGVAFLVILARRMSKRPEHTLISLSMLKRRDFQLLALAFTMTCMVIMGTQYVLPYFLQVCGKYSVIESGLLLSVASVFAIILSVPVGKWCDAHGCKLPSVLAGVGRLVFCVIFIIVTPPDDFPLLLVGLAVMGCSMAFAGTGLATALIHHADKESQADATTFMLEINYTAASLGVVLFSVVLQSGVGAATAASVTEDAMWGSFDNAMIVGCILSVVAIVCALVVKNVVPEKDGDGTAQT